MQEVLHHRIPDARRSISGFAILRVPFLLEPDYDETKVSIETNRERLLRKWGGPAAWEAQKQRHRLRERGQAVGIPHFNLDRKAANTLASHRLIQWIGRHYGLQWSERIYDRLNHYHFVEGHSLNDVERLAAVVAAEWQATTVPTEEDPAEKTPPPPPTVEEILQFLRGTEGRREIWTALSLLQQMGIHGIPTFILEGGETVLQGAVEAAELVRALRRIERRGYLLREQPLFQEILGISPTLIERGSYLATDADASTTLNHEAITQS